MKKGSLQEEQERANELKLPQNKTKNMFVNFNKNRMQTKDYKNV